MLTHTFIHLPGISELGELRLWKEGIITWDDFQNKELPLFSKEKEKILKKEIQKSILHLKNKNIEYFRLNLPKNQHWRCFSEFREKSAYLDIETTGLSYKSKITLIGVYDGKNIQHFIRGKNMDDFPEFIKNYDLLVTYNGACFDLPFIRRHFENIYLDHVHIDLRFFLRKIGLSGGLKVIEKKLGIKRSDETEDIDGKEAVRLWYDYKKGNIDALNTLIQYNTEDIKNLETIIDLTYNKVKNLTISL